MGGRKPPVFDPCNSSQVANCIQAAVYFVYFAGCQKWFSGGGNFLHQQAKRYQQEEGIDKFHGRAPFIFVRSKTTMGTEKFRLSK